LETIPNIPEAKRSKTESEQMKYSEFVKRWFHDSIFICNSYKADVAIWLENVILYISLQPEVTNKF